MLTYLEWKGQTKRRMSNSTKIEQHCTDRRSKSLKLGGSKLRAEKTPPMRQSDK